MTVPALSATDRSPLETPADVLVLGVLHTDDGPRIVDSPAGLDRLAESLEGIAFRGSRDEFRRVPSTIDTIGSIALVGLGRTVDTHSLRYAAGVVGRHVRGAASVAVALPVSSVVDAEAVLEGLAVGAYAYTVYKSAPVSSDPEGAPDDVAQAVPAASGFAVHATVPVPDEAVDRAATIATAVHTVRDLVNMPPSDLFPDSFADEARRLATDLPLTVEVLDEADLAAGGFGGILGVGQGSTRGPRLVKVSYSPDLAPAHLALVGKGITFDSGGLSLKPAASMVGMKYDMTGAATALAVIVAAAELALPVRLTAWLCLAENMPSGSAIRPNDVLRIRGGKTVEVLNTDAEGRLVLADGLVAALEEQPDAVIDIATLTGAAIVAMGNRTIPVMGDSDLVGRVVAAGERVDETMWAMPIPEELRPLLDSDVADIANAKIGNTAGGMLLAAAFLREFAPAPTPEGGSGVPWAHIDIAGAASNAGAGYGFIGKGPTGATVRALIELAGEFSRG
ncbi:leucyl aminopeptidase [Marisediminicola sp. LYQ85]|uniref:leucyl aminopeptidase n=1 Tax=Marisediminicola sp. LYQ85 TaxID=3391062 RepID=UPI003983CD0D